MSAKILVVDDDETIRGLLEAVLTAEGHSVRCACDGREGIEALREAPTDLMITDLHMPRLDGYGLIPLALEHDAELPIVVLSADSTLASIDRVYQHAIKAFLPKPFDDVSVVARKVARVLETHKTRQDLRAKLERAQALLAKVARSGGSEVS